jgi:hypothetical protein
MTPDEKREYMRRWRTEHPEYYRGCGEKGYYAKYGARYVAANADKVRATKQRWYMFRKEAERMRNILL